jgi:hypothetical protein
VGIRTRILNLRVALDDGVLFGGKICIRSDPLAVRTQRRLRDFGGELTAENATSGAAFTLKLRKVAP